MDISTLIPFLAVLTFFTSVFGTLTLREGHLRKRGL